MAGFEQHPARAGHVAAAVGVTIGLALFFPPPVHGSRCDIVIVMVWDYVSPVVQKSENKPNVNKQNVPPPYCPEPTGIRTRTDL